MGTGAHRNPPTFSASFLNFIRRVPHWKRATGWKMRRIAILIRTGHDLGADTRLAIEHLRFADIQVIEESHDDMRERVCRYVWIDDNAELEVAMKILQAAGITAIKA
jgi:hypothetical protein